MRTRTHTHTSTHTHIHTCIQCVHVHVYSVYMYMYAHVSTTVILHLLYTQINYMSTCTCILPSGRLSVMILFVSLPKDYRIIEKLMQ